MVSGAAQDIHFDATAAGAVLACPIKHLAWTAWLLSVSSAGVLLLPLPAPPDPPFSPPQSRPVEG